MENFTISVALFYEKVHCFSDNFSYKKNHNISDIFFRKKLTVSVKLSSRKKTLSTKSGIKIAPKLIILTFQPTVSVTIV